VPYDLTALQRWTFSIGPETLFNQPDAFLNQKESRNDFSHYAHGVSMAKRVLDIKEPLQIHGFRK